MPELCRGASIIYMPLAAFGLYPGEVRSVLEDGRVDIALYRLRTAVLDLELTKIDVVETRAKLRPGTCLVIQRPKGDPGCAKELDALLLAAEARE